MRIHGGIAILIAFLIWGHAPLPALARAIDELECGKYPNAEEIEKNAQKLCPITYELTKGKVGNVPSPLTAKLLFDAICQGTQASVHKHRATLCTHELKFAHLTANLDSDIAKGKGVAPLESFRLARERFGPAAGTADFLQKQYLEANADIYVYTERWFRRAEQWLEMDAATLSQNPEHRQSDADAEERAKRMRAELENVVRKFFSQDWEEKFRKRSLEHVAMRDQLLELNREICLATGALGEMSGKNNCRKWATDLSAKSTLAAASIDSGGTGSYIRPAKVSPTVGDFEVPLYAKRDAQGAEVEVDPITKLPVANVEPTQEDIDRVLGMHATAEKAQAATAKALLEKTDGAVARVLVGGDSPTDVRNIGSAVYACTEDKSVCGYLTAKHVVSGEGDAGSFIISERDLAANDNLRNPYAVVNRGAETEAFRLNMKELAGAAATDESNAADLSFLQTGARGQATALQIADLEKNPVKPGDTVFTLGSPGAIDGKAIAVPCKVISVANGQIDTICTTGLVEMGGNSGGAIVRQGSNGEPEVLALFTHGSGRHLERPFSTFASGPLVGARKVNGKTVIGVHSAGK